MWYKPTCQVPSWVSTLWVWLQFVLPLFGVVICTQSMLASLRGGLYFEHADVSKIVYHHDIGQNASNVTQPQQAHNTFN